MHFGEIGILDQSIKPMCLHGLSITYSSNPRQHIWTFAVGRGEIYFSPWNCPCSRTRGNVLLLMLAITIIVNQLVGIIHYADPISMTHYGME